MRRLLVCLVLSLGLSADEAFLLQVPLRENPTQQTGEVRVTLTLDGDPAGAQLEVNGAETVTLGQTLNLSSGDRLIFEAGGGNSAKLTFQPLSNFPIAGNFCVTGQNATPKELQLRFLGAQDIVEYRISSYSVGAPEFECSKVFKRVGDFPAIIIPFAVGNTPELAATNKGRHELDVALILDKSGSMGEIPPGAEGPPSKMQILRSALTTFVAQWAQLDAPGESTATFENDRLGLVFFDTAPAAQTVAGSFFTARGAAPPGNNHAWNAVSTLIDTLAPGGFTTVGGGINTAFEQYQLDPDHDLTLIVVTDGIQNTAPLVETGTDDILTLVPVAGFPDELRKRFTPIYTIGFGTPSGVDAQLLDRIAAQTTGFSYLAISAETMFNSFGSALVSFLKGNTISEALRVNATMTGAGPSAAQQLVIDRSVPRVVVSVQWAPPHRNALDLEITGPNGTVRTPTSSTSTDTAMIFRFDLRPEDAGTWGVRVKRAASTATMNLPYTLTALLVERQLEFSISTSPAKAATGDPITIRATVAYDHKPLGKLPGNAIRVRVQRPPEALGTILRDTPAGNASASNDIQSPYHRKVASLTSRELTNRVYPRDVETIALAEEKPGVYTGTFTGTTVPGTYAFEALLDWDDSRTGHVRRTERIEKQVKLRPDPVATIVTARPTGDGHTLIAVTPRDRFGNYLGPGYAPIVRAGDSGTVPVDIDQTGTYTFEVAGAAPPITVDGVKIDGPSNSGAPSTASWRAFVLFGPNFPHGGRRGFTEGELSVNGGVERVLTPHWSAEAILGYHGFDNRIVETNIFELSFGGRYWFGGSTFRPFAAASAGAFYVDSTRSSTRLGVTARAGLLYQLRPTLGIEGSYSYNVVNLENDSLSFSAVQAGIRWSF